MSSSREKKVRVGLKVVGTFTLAGLVFAGCDGSTNADRERLEALKSEPLLQVAPPGQTYEDRLVEGDEEWLADGDDITATFLESGVARVYSPVEGSRPIEVLQPYLDALESGGWTRVLAYCGVESEPAIAYTVTAETQRDDYIVSAMVTLYPRAPGSEASDSEKPTQYEKLVVSLGAPYHTISRQVTPAAPENLGCLR